MHAKAARPFLLVRISVLSLLTSLGVAGCGKNSPPTGAATSWTTPASGATATFAEFASSEVRKAADTYPSMALELASPLSLTTSDGTGLELVNLTGRAVIDGPLAFTELKMSFRNPEARVLEGRFSITLPDNAAISRLAMSIDGRWQEAEVVERDLAHRAYEDFLHRRQDPALLEKEAGNQFRARIFPIPANGQKDIIVSYSHVLADKDSPYQIALEGLPTIANLDLQASVMQASGQPKLFALARKNFKPEQNFDAPIANAGNGLRAKNLVAVRVTPTLNKSGSESASPENITVLFDTSASRAPGFAAQVAKLGTLVENLRSENAVNLTVAAFDQSTQLIYAGPARDFGAKELTALRARRPLGASDFVAAIDWLATSTPSGRLVIITDGIPTAGSADAGDLRKSLAKLSAINRLDAILVGGIRDQALASALVRGNFGSDGAVIDGALAATEQAKRIRLATRSGITVAVEGARWTWPQTIDGLQAGDDVVVFAEMNANNSNQPSVDIQFSGGHNEVIKVATAAAVPPLLSRSVAVAEIAKLSAERAELSAKQNAVKRERLKNRIVEISTEQRVLSDYTALLVLETEADYKRYDIKRSALSSIMRVGRNGIELFARDSELVIAKPVVAKLETMDKLKEKDGKKIRRFSDPKPAPAKKIAATTNGDGAPPAPPQEEPVPGRTFEGVLGEASGQQGDGVGTSFSGSSSVENVFVANSALEIADERDARRDQPADADQEEPGVAGGVVGGVVGGVEGAVADNDRDGGDDIDDDDDDDDDDEFAQNLKSSPPALTGQMAMLMSDVDKGATDKAIAAALSWRNEAPGDVMALIGLGAALEKAGRPKLAARAYGSIIDLFPSRADLRRFAGSRLQRLDGQSEIAVDTFAKALKQRPDHLTGHRQHAFALVRASRFADAFSALEKGIAFPFARAPSGGVQILSADLELVGAAWARATPSRRNDIEARLVKRGLKIAGKASLRFVLNWETDANDVDFHIFDGKGGHASYSKQELPSGGELYEDVTNGYGPEAFVIEGAPTAFPYRMQIHYYSRGPMGYGMGQVEVVHHDGGGVLSFDERPFVVMNDRAYIDLGIVDGPPQSGQNKQIAAPL